MRISEEMTALIRGDSHCCSVRFILGHDCTAEFNKGIIIAVFGRSDGRISLRARATMRTKYTAHYFNFFVFGEEMIQELLSFTIK